MSQAHQAPSVRNAFTLIELLGVLAVIAILGMLSVPAALAAAQRGAVNQFLANLERVCSQAQAEARRLPSPIDPTRADHFGVMLVQDGGDRYLTLLKGTTVDDAAIEMIDGTPVLRIPVPASVEILTANGTAEPAPLAGRIGWFYRYGDGVPIESPGKQAAIGVGTPAQEARSAVQIPDQEYDNYYYNYAPPLPAVAASPICSALMIRISGTTNTAKGTAITIYRNGLYATNEVRAPVVGMGMQ